MVNGINIVTDFVKKHPNKFTSTKTAKVINDNISIKNNFVEWLENNKKRLSLESERHLMHCVNNAEIKIQTLMVDYLKVDDALINLIKVYEDLLEKYNEPNIYKN